MPPPGALTVIALSAHTGIASNRQSLIRFYRLEACTVTNGISYFRSRLSVLVLHHLRARIIR